MAYYLYFVWSKIKTMKKLILRNTLLFAFGIALLSGSCGKQVAGPKGDTGAAGKDGNANVSGTNSIALSYNDWTEFGKEWLAYLFYDKITNDILNTGSVQVFMQKDNAWWGLPYLEGDAYTNYGVEAGKIKLVHGESHGGLPDRPVSANYRIVVIAASQKASHPGVNWNNYEEVCAALGTDPSAN